MWGVHYRVGFSRVGGCLLPCGLLTCVGGPLPCGLLMCVGGGGGGGENCMKCGISLKHSFGQFLWIVIFQADQPEICVDLYTKMLHVNRAWEPHFTQILYHTVIQIPSQHSFHRLLFPCLFGLFTPWCECICDRLNFRPCCHSCAGIF